MLEEATRSERFVRLFAQYQHDLFRYVLSLLPNVTDAQDVVQETAVALLGRFDQYDPSLPFLPWARRFAYYEVMNFRDRCRHDRSRVVLVNSELIERLSSERQLQEETLERRRHALSKCIERLPDESRNLIDQHYQRRISIRALAEEWGRSVHTLYSQLARARRRLMDCISRRLAAEASE
jgi:RNA polymerase sigma-70 factor (ECF subfamily)